MVDFDKIQQLIIEAGSNIEKIELAKSKVKNLIDKTFDNVNLLNDDKLKIIQKSWNIYKDYDENVMPAALNNLRLANKILRNLKK